MPSGRAIVGFREDEWVEYILYESMERNESDLNRMNQHSELVRAALAKPIFDNHVDLTAGPNVRFVHLIAAKPASIWLAVQTQLDLHKGRNKEALENVIAQCLSPEVLERRSYPYQ